MRRGYWEAEGLVHTNKIDIHFWSGMWTFKDLVPADGTVSVYSDFVPVLRERFDSEKDLKPPPLNGASALEASALE